MFKISFYKFFKYDNKKISMKFFKQRKSLSYIFFDNIFKKIILNNEIIDNEINNFNKFGFTKLDLNFKAIINEFKHKFFILDNEKNTSKKKVLLTLNEVDKNKLYFEIKKKINPLIKKLEVYFNCNVILSQIITSRNYNHSDKNNLNISHYANHFHQDNYLITYNKIFINLMDITENDGPLEVISKENKDKFIKSFKYKDMYNYNLDGDPNLIHKNTGKIGESFLFSSSEVFHRAGVPDDYRDSMMLILVAIPYGKSEGLNKINEGTIYNDNSKIIHSVTKPYKVLKLIKLFLVYIGYKFGLYKNEQNYQS